jgi:hypothetical protein
MPGRLDEPTNLRDCDGMLVHPEPVDGNASERRFLRIEVD